MDELPPGLGGSARHEACRCDRPRVHHRVGPAVRAPFDRPERVEREPGGVHPEPAARLLVAERLTDQREHERLGDAHDRELVLGVPDRVDVAAGADHADAEQLARHPRQGRVDLGILAFRDRPVALVRLVDQSPHLLGGRQLARRYVRGIGDLVLRRAHGSLPTLAAGCRRDTGPDRRSAGARLRPGSARCRRAPRADASPGRPGATS